MKKLIITMALALAACGPQTGKDGYTFEKKTTLIAPRAIKVVLYPSVTAVKAQYAITRNATPIPASRALQAFSVINATTCTIHMVDPKVNYMPEFIGHELTHCLYGEFHPSQND